MRVSSKRPKFTASLVATRKKIEFAFTSTRARYFRDIICRKARAHTRDDTRDIKEKFPTRGERFAPAVTKCSSDLEDDGLIIYGEALNVKVHCGGLPRHKPAK